MCVECKECDKKHNIIRELRNKILLQLISDELDTGEKRDLLFIRNRVNMAILNN